MQEQFPILPKDVYTQLEERARANKQLEAMKDTSIAMRAAPIVAGLSEAAKLRGGSGVNLNPLLAWSSGLPGADRQTIGAVIQQNPYVSPTDTIAKLMGMGKEAAAVQQQYLKERDKFFATQMGRPVGAAGLAGKSQLQQEKIQGQKELKEMDTAAKIRIKQMELEAEEDAAERKRLKDEIDELKDEKKEQEKRLIDARKEFAPIKKNSLNTVASAYQAVSSIEQIFSKYENTGNYPGVGVGLSDASTIAKKLFTDPREAWEYTNDAQLVRAKFRELIALRNRTLSGLQSTDKEFQRAIQQLGDAPWQTEETAIQGIRDLVRAMGKGLDVDYKSLSPEAQNLWDEAGMYRAEDFYDLRIGGARVGEPTRRRQTGGGKKKEVKRQYSPSRDKTRITYDDGSTEIVDGKQTK